jgi:hypothetical protein
VFRRRLELILQLASHRRDGVCAENVLDGIEVDRLGLPIVADATQAAGECVLRVEPSFHRAVHRLDGTC